MGSSGFPRFGGRPGNAQACSAAESLWLVASWQIWGHGHGRWTCWKDCILGGASLGENAGFGWPSPARDLLVSNCEALWPLGSMGVICSWAVADLPQQHSYMYDRSHHWHNDSLNLKFGEFQQRFRCRAQARNGRIQ